MAPALTTQLRPLHDRVLVERLEELDDKQGSIIRRIVELAARHRLPATYGSGVFPEVGGLLSYGQPAACAGAAHVGAGEGADRRRLIRRGPDVGQVRRRDPHRHARRARLRFRNAPSPDAGRHRTRLRDGATAEDRIVERRPRYPIPTTRTR